MSTNNNNNYNYNTSTIIQSSKYHGHQGSVLCLDYHCIDSLLLSGSEDCTARIWDIRTHDTKRRASLCISTPGEVLSVSFVPPPVSTSRSTPSTTTDPYNNNNNNNNPFARNHTVFLASERSVLEYDLRQVSTPIVTTPTKDWTSIFQNQDEVNQISLMYYLQSQQQSQSQSQFGGNNNNKKNKNKSKGNKSKKIKSQQSSLSSNEPILYMATADDAGMVRFTTCTTNANTTTTAQQPQQYSTSCTIAAQTLAHDPEGIVVVPTCAFRPITTATTGGGFKKQQQNLELVSGGTDCKIHLWDLFKPKRPISSINIQTPQVIQDSSSSSSSSNKPQVCNPPMVHTLAWNRNGTLLAAGLGDGNIPIYTLENRKLVPIGFLPDGHDSSVASIAWANFDSTFDKNNNYNHNDNNDNSDDMDIDDDDNDNNNNNKNETLDQSQQRILFSGGSDGTILCWDVGSYQDNDDELLSSLFDEDMNTKPTTTSTTTTTNSKANAMTSKLQSLSISLSQRNNNNNNNNKSTTTRTTSWDLFPKEFVQLYESKQQQQQQVSLSLQDNNNTKSNNTTKIMFGIPHGNKLNWITTTGKEQSTGRLFAADTSNDITAYAIPLR